MAKTYLQSRHIHSDPPSIHVGVAFATILLVLAGCESRDWRRASHTGTIESYAKFIAQHPGSALAEVAERHILELDWKRVAQLDTVPAYKSHLGTYPQSPHAREVEKRIDEIESAHDTEGIEQRILEYLDLVDKTAAAALPAVKTMKCTQGHSESFRSICSLPKDKNDKPHARQECWDFILSECNGSLGIRGRTVKDLSTGTNTRTASITKIGDGIEIELANAHRYTRAKGTWQRL